MLFRSRSDVQVSRTVEGGGGAGASCEGCTPQASWGRASRHSAGHGEPRGDVQRLRTVGGGRGARASSEGCSPHFAWSRTSSHSADYRAHRGDKTIKGSGRNIGFVFETYSICGEQSLKVYVDDANTDLYLVTQSISPSFSRALVYFVLSHRLPSMQMPYRYI